MGLARHNGVTLGNDRLGFVATSLTTDGGVGLVGYYVEEDRPLAPEERLRFSPGETPPGPAGVLPSVDWDAERLAKVERNDAMDYVRSMLPELCAVLGPADAASVGRLAGRQIGCSTTTSSSTCSTWPRRRSPTCSGGWLRRWARTSPSSLTP